MVEVGAHVGLDLQLVVKACAGQFVHHDSLSMYVLDRHVQKHFIAGWQIRHIPGTR